MNDFLLQDYLFSTARKYPYRYAVQYDDKKVTYTELLQKSCVVADYLVKAGVKKDVPVILYLDKSDKAVEAVFGILISGGVYVPVDTITSPVYRCAAIIEQSMSNFLITSGANLEKIVSDSSFKQESLKKLNIIVLDHQYSLEKNLFLSYVEVDWTLQIEKESFSRGSKEDSAYILYTSGSTGKPKGVVLSHLNGSAFVDWCLDYFKPCKEDRFLSVTPFHFDLSVFDLYVSIACGGCLVMTPFIKERNIHNLILYLKQEQITYIYSVPSLWIAFLKYGKLQKGDFSCLKKILFAGEVFPPKYLKEAASYVPSADFYNLYGLIETNVFTYYKVNTKNIQGVKNIPIGYPCCSSETVIMKDGKIVTQAGVEGELCVQGPTVMKEYYKEKELTDKAFVTVKGKDGKSIRFFRTGDIVKKDEDGAFIYISRNDFMVKRNGYRVELPEIEAVLFELDFVREAAVVAVRDKENNIFICAALQTEGEQKLGTLSLKQAVGEKLPTYMIPDFYLVVPEFVRSTSGKVDRQWLRNYFSEKYLREESE